MLSIIIPTLNEEKYLPLLLDSIRLQDFKDYEIIVADAGSKDKTVDIAKKYGCAVVKGGLPSVGRNRGAEVAKGDILLFLDADGVLTDQNFLSKILSGFSKRKLDLAGFPQMLIGRKKIDKVAYSIWNNLAFFTQNFLPHAAGVIMIKTHFHKKIGGFDEQIVFVEDHPYVRKATKIAKFGFIKEPVSFSARRYDKDGRLKTYFKFFFAGLHLLVIGPIKSDIFKYKFGHYEEDEKSTKK